MEPPSLLCLIVPVRYGSGITMDLLDDPHVVRARRRRHLDRSTDPALRPLGTVKLRELTADRVAAWSQANEHVNRSGKVAGFFP